MVVLSQQLGKVLDDPPLNVNYSHFNFNYATELYTI
jgi:hypothetical protein